MASSPLDFLLHLQEGHLTCRELGHAWRKLPLTRHRAYGYVRRLKCRECGTGRVDHLGMRGDVLDRYYEWPDGYRAPHGASKWGLSREDFSREAMRREGLDVQLPGWEVMEAELRKAAEVATR